MDSAKQQGVELLAYYIYLAEGQSEGHALDHWCEAEFQIKMDRPVIKSESTENNH
jgi:hypothetical protein